MNKPAVDYFLASVLISNGYGRSYNEPNMLHASTDEIVYHTQTYAGRKLNKLSFP